MKCQMFLFNIVTWQLRMDERGSTGPCPPQLRLGQHRPAPSGQGRRVDRVGHSHWTARHTSPARLPVITTQRQGHTCHGSALRPPTLKLVLGAQHEDQRAVTRRDNEPGNCLPTSLRKRLGQHRLICRFPLHQHLTQTLSRQRLQLKQHH